MHMYKIKENIQTCKRTLIILTLVKANKDTENNNAILNNLLVNCCFFMYNRTKHEIVNETRKIILAKYT